jgi:VWFA-related protein
MPARDEVRRTFVFVVSNYSMDFTQVHRLRMALRKFVETQMQPGDLVAIVPTAGGNAAFQMFSSDKRHLLSIIDNLRWFIDVRTTTAMPDMMAVSYYIRALQDMPGRKSLIYITPFTMFIGEDDMFNGMSDAAMRAGVVIHTLNISGLKTPAGIDGQRQVGVDFVECRTPLGFENKDCQQEIVKSLSQRVAKTGINRKESPLPLSKKTGGVLVSDSNWFLNGIGENVNEDLKGYYLLTYVPPANTFTGDIKFAYHRIRIKMKESKYEVHTRDGFFGISRPLDALAGNSDSLRAAIFSPFRYYGLKANLSSGYIRDHQKGYLIHSWMHLDAKDLAFVERENGGYSVSVDAACISSDAGNFIRDSSARRYEFSFKEEEVPWVKNHGLEFSMILPVRDPGAYYVRTAVKDLVSGKIGSAYQFIEIPDLKTRRLSLSNLFIMDRDEDVPWARSEAPQEFQKVFSPDMRRDLRKSPALRNYLPGETIEYAAVVYNANAGKNPTPDLESQYLLFTDGKEVYKSKPVTVDTTVASDLAAIPIRKRILLADSLQPGDYILQLFVREKRSKNKSLVASQALDFRILDGIRPE